MREPGFWYRPRSWKSHLLRPLGALYGAVAARRLRRKGIDAGIPVVCVGNYHVGGAGKTPTVLALANLLRDLRETPVVLSRGYGGRLRGPVMVDPNHHVAAEVGDEPLMMARSVPVVVARRRTCGIALAKSLGATVILMDDGFQNPAIAKDVSVIVIDGGRGIGNGRVFPAGPLRAPILPQILRTDALIIVGEGAAGEEIASAIAGRDRPVLRAHLQPDPASLDRIKGRRVLAFAGIGDPSRFFNTLRASGVEVVSEQAFPDHHVFCRREIDRLHIAARKDDLVLVTTEKDMARLRGPAELPAWARDVVVFAVTLEFDDPSRLRSFLADRLLTARQGSL